MDTHRRRWLHTNPDLARTWLLMLNPFIPDNGADQMRENSVLVLCQLITGVRQFLEEFYVTEAGNVPDS